MSSTSMNRWEQSSAGDCQITARVPEDLKEEFRETCDAQGTTMTDVLRERMAAYVEEHGAVSRADPGGGYYPEDDRDRALYEACLKFADDHVIYQRRHARRIAQETQETSVSDLAADLQPLRRKGFVALGPMPIDLSGERADRWRHWRIKPACADPQQWVHREGR